MRAANRTSTNRAIEEESRNSMLTNRGNERERHKMRFEREDVKRCRAHISPSRPPVNLTRNFLSTCLARSRMFSRFFRSLPLSACDEQMEEESEEDEIEKEERTREGGG